MEQHTHVRIKKSFHGKANDYPYQAGTVYQILKQSGNVVRVEREDGKVIALNVNDRTVEFYDPYLQNLKIVLE